MKKFSIQDFLALLTSLSQKNPKYFWGFIIFAFFFFDFLILMRPQIGGLLKAGPKINVLKEDLKQTQDNIQKFPEYQKEVERLNRVADELNFKIQSKEALPLILERISKLANHNGVKIDQIMPESQNEEVLLEDGKKRYSAVPITIEARSSYHNFGRFLNQIEQDDISLMVGNFTIIARTESKDHAIRLILHAVVFEEI